MTIKMYEHRTMPELYLTSLMQDFANGVSTENE